MAIKFKNRQNGCQGQLVHKSQKRPDFENLKPQGTKMAPFDIQNREIPTFLFSLRFLSNCKLKVLKRKESFSQSLKSI